MKTEIKRGNSEVLQGISELADLVGTTLGPKGRNVLIERPGYYPEVTKDGVTVAESVDLECPIKNLGVGLIKQVASNTANSVGDGTTTSTVLANALIQNFDEKGDSAIEQKRAYDKDLDLVLSELDNLKFEDVSTEILGSIGTVSANNDPKVGLLVSNVVDNVTENGLVLMESGNTGEDQVEYVSGYTFEKGYVSPYFINGVTQNVEFHDPLILLFSGKIAEVQKFGIFVQRMYTEHKRPIVVIATEVSNEVLKVCVTNVQRQKLPLVVVKAPEYGDLQFQVLEDIAYYTGGQVISNNSTSLEVIDDTYLGECEKIDISKDMTVIMGGYGDDEELKKRADFLKELGDNEANEHLRDRYYMRWSKLQNNVAKIFVGGSSETEMKERKFRMEDAVQACMAAKKGGVVPGGGYTLYKIAENLKGKISKGFYEALKVPMHRILENAGEDIKIGDKCIKKGMVYNALSQEYVPPIEGGVVDPFLVTKNALTNAVSIAGMMLLTDNVIYITKQPTPAELHGLV